MISSARRGVVLAIAGWAFAAIAVSAVGRWTALGPFRSDGTPVSVQALVTVPGTSVLYAAGDDALYRSEDRGDHWSVALADASGVVSVAVDPRTPSTVYAGAYDGLFRSTDAGGTWSLVLERAVLALATAPSAVYAASVRETPEARASVFKSTDSGATWTHVLDAIEFDDFHSLAVDTQSSERVYAGTDSEYFFRSEDGGGTWSFVRSIWYGSIYSIAVDPQSPSTLYAASSVTVGPIGPFPCNVAKSTDFGRTWSVLPGLPALGYSSVAVEPIAPHRVYASITDTVYRSDDAGSTWAPITSDPTQVFALAYAFDPLRAGRLFIATYGGVYEIALDSGRGPVEQPGASRPKPVAPPPRPAR